jgi:hypothetical protein
VEKARLVGEEGWTGNEISELWRWEYPAGQKSQR